MAEGDRWRQAGLVVMPYGTARLAFVEVRIAGTLARTMACRSSQNTRYSRGNCG